MKRCPECRRDYYDDSLSFCLDDGSRLLDGPAFGVPPSGGSYTDARDDEPATAILSEPGAVGGGFRSEGESSESKTAILSHAAAEAEPPKTSGDSSERQNLSAHQAAKPQGTVGSWQRQLAVFAIAVLLLVGGFFGYRYFKSADTEKINSIAVLPFQNKNSDADTDYLSDGLADSLIYRLSQLPNLKVSPTSSVMRYKGADTDIAQIAKELEVDAVMSGRLSQRGDDISINVQLIDSRTKKLIWAEQYERKMTDLLATQREIAAAITQKLQLKLAGTDAKGITKRYTDSNEAYQHYLKGRYFLNKRDEENLKKAIVQFKAAVSNDPNYALAYVGLAECNAVLPFYSNMASNEVLREAKAYAERALEIDDSLGEAHSSLGYANMYLWNWPEAQKELRRGIELNPNYSTAHKFYGNYLSNLGRFDEAAITLKRAQELEPLSLIISVNLGDAYLENEDLKSASEQFQRAIDLDPNWHVARRQLALVYLKQGRTTAALAEAEKSLELSKRQSITLGFLGYVYSQAGESNKAVAVIEELTTRYANRQANGYDIARVYVGLGDNDAAFAWLEKDFQSRNAIMVAWLYLIPFDSLREDRRFIDLSRRLGMLEVK